MPMSKDDIITLIRNIAYETARTQYGIQDVEGFIKGLTSIVGYEDPAFDPAAQGDNGHSIGLFQLHDQGAGAGMSVADRSNPEINIRKAISYLGPIFADSEKQGQPFETALSRMISEGQVPADPQLGFQRAMAFIQDHVWTGQGGTQAEGVNGGMREWMKSLGMDDKQINIALMGGGGASWAKAYLEATGGTTTEPREWETPGYQARQAGLTEETALGNVETELGLGLAGYGISNDEYERQRGYYADQVEAGKLTLDQATNKFNAWMNATAEAGRRAEYVTNIKEERAKRTLPTPFFPTTQPGGELDVLAQKYGLPHTPLAGAPLSSFPSPEAAYEQYRSQMGISQQAPQIPDVAVPTAPTPPQGGSAARQYAEEFLRRSGIQIPALGGV